jgi:hypothetical protein
MAEFKHERIDEQPPSAKLGFRLTIDLTDGREDVVGTSYGPYHHVDTWHKAT